MAKKGKLAPGKRPVPEKPDHDTPKTGRSDGTEGQLGSGFEAEISINPLDPRAQKKK